MKSRILSAILHGVVFLSFVSIVNASNYVLLIGGGPSLNESQSSIEQNVLWSERIIKEKNPRAIFRIFYSDGDDPAPDIVNHVKMEDPDASLLPFDRVYSEEAATKEYYNHSIKELSGTTAPEHMKPIIINDFRNLTSNDSVLILYNGHGGYDPTDLSNNYLRLWGEKRLTVYDFESMLSELKPDIPVRYIMTQCFSGGFTSAIHHGANNDTFELAGNRCGFMSQSARRESEGCTASLDIGDYRDYSTYFFAALDGKTRQNTPLTSNPDIDGDGKVNLREAHLYALATAYSSDLSRTTSEDYLEKWEPWYLRWISEKKRQKKSIYYSTATKLAKNNNIDTRTLDNPNALRKMHVSMLEQHGKLAKQDTELKNAIKAIQTVIQKKLAETFPDIKDGYQKQFTNYNKEKFFLAKKTILESNQYAKLKELFTRRAEIVEPLIDSKRKLTQTEKLYRLLKIARLDGFFPTFANKMILTNYNKLLSCENTTL